MEHDLVAAAVGLFREFAGIEVEGEKGKSERVRKGEDGIGDGAIVTEVVQDDGEARSAGADGRWGMGVGVLLGGIARLRTKIPGGFGIVTSNEASE